MPAPDPLSISSDALLIVEGKTDVIIPGSLMRQCGIAGYQPIRVAERGPLREVIKALVNAPGFRSPVPGFGHPVKSMAIVLDAEENATVRFQSICDALDAAGLPVPMVADQFAAGPPRVGVFLVPDNESPGNIEELCLRSVCDDPAHACVDEYFECLRVRGVSLPRNLPKARAQAFLASRPEPQLPVGRAADEGYWSFNAPCFVALAEFLRGAFDD